MHNEPSPVDRLFADYVREHRRGSADPGAYLAQTEGTDRHELAALIDGYLARQPRRAFEPEAFANSTAGPLADGLHRSLHGEAGLWPVVLPRLRVRSGLSEDAVVTTLAEALGVPKEEPEVARYYEAMEAGRLPAEGVDNRVLTALAEVLGTTAAALQQAGVPIIESESRSRPHAPDAAEVRDVDRLFRGGQQT